MKSIEKELNGRIVTIYEDSTIKIGNKELKPYLKRSNKTAFIAIDINKHCYNLAYLVFEAFNDKTINPDQKLNFIDNNKGNCSIDNLAVIYRAREKNINYLKSIALSMNIEINIIGEKVDQQKDNRSEKDQIIELIEQNTKKSKIGKYYSVSYVKEILNLKYARKDIAAALFKLCTRTKTINNTERYLLMFRFNNEPKDETEKKLYSIEFLKKDDKKGQFYSASQVKKELELNLTVIAVSKFLKDYAISTRIYNGITEYYLLKLC